MEKDIEDKNKNNSVDYMQKRPGDIRLYAKLNPDIKYFSFGNLAAGVGGVGLWALDVPYVYLDMASTVLALGIGGLASLCFSDIHQTSLYHQLTDKIKFREKNKIDEIKKDRLTQKELYDLSYFYLGNKSLRRTGKLVLKEQGYSNEIKPLVEKAKKWADINFHFLEGIQKVQKIKKENGEYFSLSDVIQLKKGSSRLNLDDKNTLETIIGKEILQKALE